MASSQRTNHGGRSLAPAYIAAIGTFAIGTEGFMIAPLLPKMSDDLGLPISVLGSLVTVFTLTLAITSPLLTVAFSKVDRRKLLINTMIAFGAANLVAFASRGFWGIFSARILLAMAAGLYTPNANALVGGIVAKEIRGRALAIVNGGLTIAIALGLPLGSLIGNAFGWRMTFLGVGALSVITILALIAGLPRTAGEQTHVASMKERFAVIGRPVVATGLLVTFFWALGTYSVWTFIAPYLAATAGLGPAGISAVVSVWGIGAAIGMMMGGTLNDFMGAKPVVFSTLVVAASIFVALFLIPRFADQPHAVIPAVLVVAVWGVAIFAFYPPQIANLIHSAQSAVPIVLSLNTSAMYLGFAAGSSIGAVVLSLAGAFDLPVTGIIGEGLALAIAVVAALRSRSQPDGPGS